MVIWLPEKIYRLFPAVVLLVALFFFFFTRSLLTFFLVVLLLAYAFYIFERRIKTYGKDGVRSKE